MGRRRLAFGLGEQPGFRFLCPLLFRGFGVESAFGSEEFSRGDADVHCSKKYFGRFIMRKIFALALLALAVAGGGVAYNSAQKPVQVACENSGC